MLWLSDALGTQILLSFGHGSSGYLSPYALGTRTLLWFEHGCFGYRTHSVLWFGHGCSGYRMHWEHARYCGLRMDALVIGCTQNTNVLVVKAWMRWLSDALRTRTLSWFEHGCSGYRMHSEHECYYGLGRRSQRLWVFSANSPSPPPTPPEAKLRNPAKQGSENPPACKNMY